MTYLGTVAVTAMAGAVIGGVVAVIGSIIKNKKDKKK